MSTTKLFVLLVALLVEIDTKVYNIYWRDFHGEIPEDAVPGGLDRGNKTTYISQVFALNYGMLPSRLYQGEYQVSTSSGGSIYTSDVFIQVLCSDQPNKLMWIPFSVGSIFNADPFFSTYAAPGGTENGNMLNIGRVTYQNEVIVGKISYQNTTKNYVLTFPFGEEEISTTSFETLVVNDEVKKIIEL